MATDREILKESQKAMIGSTPASSPAAAVNSAHERPISYAWTDYATVGTIAIGETGIYYARNKAVVKGFVFTPPVAITSNDTTYATITLRKRTAGGTGTSICAMATTTTGTGDIAALTPVAGTLTASAVQLAAGDSLTLQLTKASTGVVCCGATSYANCTIHVEEN